MYYPALINRHPDFRSACIKGMLDTCNLMLRIPIPIIVSAVSAFWPDESSN